jgi:hypothetical protein
VSSRNTGTPIRFTADQVEPGTGSNASKFYIKGLAGTGAAEVVALPATYKLNDVPKADGTGYEDNVLAVDNGVSAHNLTGDSRID